MNHPTSITASDVIPLGLEDELIAAARRFFDAQKKDLLQLALSLAEAPVPVDDANRLARLVHNIAGTASYFGEADLGQSAMSIELRLHEHGTDVSRQAACQSLVSALGSTR